ncbi:MAG: hypothetical protein E5Y31_13195 [Mesorhizobium sp.]|nr:MAG: hypothetical protein E5Y31_13195 [Mesorhizobium sp.]
MLRYITILLAASVLAAWLAWQHYQNVFYENGLPEAIQVSGIISKGSDATILSREACGGVIFGLADETVFAVKKRGLSFFLSARQGRGYAVDTREGYYHSYAEWRETPVPEGWVGGEGIFSLSLSCMNNSSAMDKAISEALKLPGSYFTRAQESELVVIPSLKMAVLAYYG